MCIRDSFEVYSPNITSLYSQVFWKGLDPVDLPADIVHRYAGKGMAVVGVELDQGRRTPAGDVSVPINVAYNHHFESNMVGTKSKMSKLRFSGPHDPRIRQMESAMGHRLPSTEEHWVVEDLAPGNTIPTSQSFGGANGGEVRKSYHGYAPGFAQVIDSPTQFQITPMQIDTWNRDRMNVTGPTKFVPGPLPRNSLAPADAEYSGLLECPVTTRLHKQIDGGYITTGSGQCTDQIVTASECFGAAASTFGSDRNFTNTEGSDPTKPVGCSARSDGTDPSLVHVFYNKNTQSAECGSGATTLAGSTASLVTVDVSLKGTQAHITLTGPSNVWFGVGFNASAMKDQPWAIVIDGSGNVTERRLADQSPGALLPSTLTVLSSTTKGSLRTVKLGTTESHPHFAFDISRDASLPFINAIGNGPTLAYHKNKDIGTLALLPVDGAGACLCANQPAPFGQGKGKFVYQPVKAQPADTGSGTIGFGNVCQPEPRTDMLAMKNPTCDVRTYTGGQTACHHMFSLLDADQEIPWTDQPLVYHLKFRFWVQPYNASYHSNVGRSTWGIASPVEYDVPKCGEGVLGCAQQPDGNWVHTIRGTYSGGGKLVAAHFHCHAPTCLSVAMYRCDKSVAVCNETVGELLCMERPVYGGTGQIDRKDMDEPGFILQPPCLWGSSEQGLEPPPDTDPTKYTLHSVKTSNATNGHHGEMAWQQMYIV
eukprot:TRINITY_DN44215_c0_g1_i1.p1 TRINITY_DN44215_c0_g1~~TRINITY_DN44215_c0_g1_i1.p1  ORF type:complete len:708 (-),score=147.60 TRINITY_DN44215_c0_g1_i1:102-2225(-)